MAGNKKQSKRIAVILFADVMNSSEISNSLSFEEYDKFIQEFQSTMLEILSHHILKNNDFKNDKLRKYEASVRGDEVCLILYSDVSEEAIMEEEEERRRYKIKDIKLALLIAIEMKRKWLTSNINAQRIKDGRSILDIGIGINCGAVIVGDHKRIDASGCVNRQKTAEGYAINLAKRIEGYSRSGEYSKIFVSRSIYNILRIEFQIAFSQVHMATFKGIAQQIPVFEVKSVGHVEDTQFAPSLTEKEERIYGMAVEYNPHDLWLILDLAHYFFDKESYEKAINTYKLALEIDPDFVPAHMYLGRSFYRNLFPEDAYPHLERARELNPDSARANNFLAVCLRRMGYLLKRKDRIDEVGAGEEWKNYYRRALELHETAMRIVEGDHTRYRWAFNAYALTLAQAEADDVFGHSKKEKDAMLKKALSHVEKVLALGHDQSNLFHHVKGYVLCIMEKHNEAKEEFERAIEYLREAEKISPKKYREKISEIYFHTQVIDRKIPPFKMAVAEAFLGDIIWDKRMKKEDAIKKIRAEKEERQDFLKKQYWYQEVESFLAADSISVENFINSKLANFDLDDEHSNGYYKKIRMDKVDKGIGTNTAS